MWFLWLAENGAKGLTNSINISLFFNKMVDEFSPKLRPDQRHVTYTRDCRKSPSLPFCLIFGVIKSNICKVKNWCFGFFDSLFSNVDKFGFLNSALCSSQKFVRVNLATRCCVSSIWWGLLECGSLDSLKLL
jgi:hypothetical protein